MKLHLTQKIGLAGISFVFIIAFVFYIGGYFSPFVFAFAIPFCVLILIGCSIKTSKQQKRL
tara:strand:- start:11702 stop:11884 length:183 start_codon:yes stop_codon:yes gene_type:complete